MTDHNDEALIQLVVPVSLFTGIGLAWMAGAYAFDALGAGYAIGASIATIAPCSLAVAVVLTLAIHLYRRFSR